MTERRTADDLEPDREVYVGFVQGNKSPAHLTRDCRHVGDEHVEKEAGVLFDDTPVCRRCDGQRADNERRKALRHMISRGELEI